MPATRLDIQWMEDATEPQDWASMRVRHIALPRPAARCPECHAILYSRRHRLCGVCGRAVPVELLFSAEEAARIHHLLTTEREKHRAWMNRRLELPAR